MFLPYDEILFYIILISCNISKFYRFVAYIVHNNKYFIPMYNAPEFSRCTDLTFK